MKLLEISWLDAQSNGETWSELKEAQKESVSCALTVGYLVNENKDSLTLTMSQDKENGMVGPTLVIPKINIKKKRILK